MTDSSTTLRPTTKGRQFLLSLGVGFIANNLVGTLVAVLILNPLLNPMFGTTIRTAEQGLQMPSLLAGYFVLTAMMVWGYRYFNYQAVWWWKGILSGFLTGLIIFLAGHLIVAGWSVLPPAPMLISGVLDILSTVATGLVIAYFYRHG